MTTPTYKSNKNRRYSCLDRERAYFYSNFGTYLECNRVECKYRLSGPLGKALANSEIPMWLSNGNNCVLT